MITLLFIRCFTALLVCATCGSLCAQVQRYDRLCTAGDDYSTAFRSTRAGTEIWFNSSFGMRNPESRRLVRVTCDTAAGAGFTPLPAPINQEEKDAFRRVLDGSPTFPTCDTSYGVFASNRLVNGVNMDNDLYEMMDNHGVWSVRRADVLNSDGWDDSPTISADGTLLFFASSRGRFKGTGLTDIYMSRKKDGAWQTPERVADINTEAAREEAPFLGNDGYLYFSTDRDGDMDIYRVRVDLSSGALLSSPQPVPYEGVNRRGSDEGVPSLSAGGAWFVFSSNRRDDSAGKKDYDIHMTRVSQASDTIDVNVEMRTQFYNELFEDYEDQTLPCTTEVYARDNVSGEVFNATLSSNGTARLVLPRKGVTEPCMDFRYRQIVVSAKPPVIAQKDFESEHDTLVFDVMSSVSLKHNFYLWDKAMPQERECVQNFRVVQVQFFLTCYWCPTTYAYSSFARCQSVFRDTSCTALEVTKPVVPCSNGDLYSYRLNYVEPTVSVMRNAGLCIPAKELSDEAAKRDWSVRVDSAINKFITDMRASLQRPCVQRAIQRGEVIDVSVIGWTDPRSIDESCRYTGATIDFNSTYIRLKDLAKREKYMPGGILKSGTPFAKSNSGSGGNELLSDVRAYYTAALLDSLWTRYVDEYRALKQRTRPQIRIEAVGNAINPERKDKGSNERDYALRRAVNVVVRAPGDDPKAKVKDVVTGRTVPLTGPPCEALLQRSPNR